MSEFDFIRIQPTASSGNLPVPEEKLTGKDIIVRCVMYALMSVGNPMGSNVDLAEEIWKNIIELADFSNGILDAEWLCFNLRNEEIGMAYKYNDSWRIRTKNSSDDEIRKAQNERISSRDGVELDD